MRFLLYLVIALVVLTAIRMFAGVLTKGLGSLFESEQQPRTDGRAAPATGELKRDPVCGTFVATSSSVKKTVDGETVHFCSAACRDKYAG
jgi:YHS domain-containing protein